MEPNGNGSESVPSVSVTGRPKLKDGLDVYRNATFAYARNLAEQGVPVGKACRMASFVASDLVFKDGSVTEGDVERWIEGQGTSPKGGAKLQDLYCDVLTLVTPF